MAIRATLKNEEINGRSEIMNYRVDIFFGEHNDHEWAFFETLEKARHFAEMIKHDGLTIFILEKSHGEARNAVFGWNAIEQV